MLCLVPKYRVLVLGGSGGVGTFAVQVCVDFLHLCSFKLVLFHFDHIHTFIVMLQPRGWIRTVEKCNKKESRLKISVANQSLIPILFQCF